MICRTIGIEQSDVSDVVVPRVLYASGTWRASAEERRRMIVFDPKCLRAGRSNAEGVGEQFKGQGRFICSELVRT